MQDTDFSLYQKHLPKLQENILRYYWWGLFKEIAIVEATMASI